MKAVFQKGNMANVENMLRESKAHVLVIGAGRSGLAATKLLLARGHRVTLYDDHPREKLRYLNDAKLMPNGDLSLVFHEVPKLLPNTSVVVVSPGVPPHHALLRAAHYENLPIISEIDLGMVYLGKQRLLGVTGSNGKSTTTVMLTSMLNAGDINAVACGNLGRPFTDVILANEHNYNYFVLELSSFQLESSHYLRLDGAIIVNITPDHLDRHADFAEYQNAKLKIARFLTPCASLVVHNNLRALLPPNSDVRAFHGDDFSHAQFFDASIRGFHNHENAMAAAMLARAVGLNDNAILAGLKAFKALPHRCEIVANTDDILFVNDSKGTTVEAVKKALLSFPQPTHLLLGGIAKGENFGVLRTEHFSHIKGYYVYGRDQQKIMNELNSPRATAYHDMKAAMVAARIRARPGDAIVLSPGCASYDQFDDYQQRGDIFRQLATNESYHQKV